jgi:hypothetical protein
MVRMSIRRISALTLSLFTLLGTAASSRATILLNEPFTYADGRLDVVGSPTWARVGGTSDDLLVSGNKLLISDLANDDAAGALSSSVNSGSLYASFSLTGDSLDRTTSISGTQYFASFFTSATAFLGRVSPAIPGGTPAGTFRLGIANGTTSADQILATNLTLGTTYTVVIKFDFSTKQTTMWVNPTTEADTSVTAIDAVTGSPTVGKFAFRQPGADTMGDYAIDNLKVGTAFSDVVIPEPASVGLLLAAGSMLLGRRRN